MCLIKNTNSIEFSANGVIGMDNSTKTQCSQRVKRNISLFGALSDLQWSVH